MEHAPLRPVPSRPAGPVEPAAAAHAVALALPDLEPPRATALALALAGRPRAEAASAIGLDEVELARTLAAARKALRRTLRPLPGSGWCERAEGLISDRLDGDLGERDAARLDTHLRNCPRCVEHERRLVQATDMLLAGLVEPPPAPDPATPPAELSIVEKVEEVEVETLAPSPTERPAGVPEPSSARSTRRRVAAASWNVLTVFAVILTLAALALVVAGVLGADV